MIKRSIIHVAVKFPSGKEADFTTDDRRDAQFVYDAFKNAGTVARIYRLKEETIDGTGGG